MSYPSEFSDLFLQMSLMNVSGISHGAVVDGRYLAGDMLFQITSHPHFTWTVFNNWTFRHFSRPIATRQYTWSPGPYIVFRDSSFEDSSDDLFKMKGGTIIFENCVFRNIGGRVIKGISEATAEFVDCMFENCSSVFLHGCEAMFTNCIFKDMKGQRGGAIHSIKSTLHVENCKFIRCSADINGGAIYIRDSEEHFESEIIGSCFIGNVAGVNGSSVYAYLSHLTLKDNCYDSNNSIIEHMSELVEETNNEIDSKCTKCLSKPNKNVIHDDFSPCDTFKWWQLDDLKPGSIIVIDDEDELDVKDTF